LFLLAVAASMDFRAATLFPVLLAMRNRVRCSLGAARDPRCGTATSSTSALVFEGMRCLLIFLACCGVVLLIDVHIFTAPSPLNDGSLVSRMQTSAPTIWRAVHGFDLQVRELVPSIGPAWYMMME
jgi:hypothetical protein